MGRGWAGLRARDATCFLCPQGAAVTMRHTAWLGPDTSEWVAWVLPAVKKL